MASILTTKREISVKEDLDEVMWRIKNHEFGFICVTEIFYGERLNGESTKYEKTISINISHIITVF
jgi:hypothetical protein